MGRGNSPNEGMALFFCESKSVYTKECSTVLDDKNFNFLSPSYPGRKEVSWYRTAVPKAALLGAILTAGAIALALNMYPREVRM